MHPRVAAQEGRFLILGRERDLLDQKIRLFPDLGASQNWCAGNISTRSPTIASRRTASDHVSRISGSAFPQPRFTRPVRTSQFRNIATKSRATGSVRNSSSVNFILRLQFGYCQVVAGRFCWAISLVRSS